MRAQLTCTMDARRYHKPINRVESLLNRAILVTLSSYFGELLLRSTHSRWRISSAPSGFRLLQNDELSPSRGGPRHASLRRDERAAADLLVDLDHQNAYFSES